MLKNQKRKITIQNSICCCTMNCALPVLSFPLFSVIPVKMGIYLILLFSCSVFLFFVFLWARCIVPLQITYYTLLITVLIRDTRYGFLLKKYLRQFPPFFIYHLKFTYRFFQRHSYYFTAFKGSHMAKLPLSNQIYSSHSTPKT